MPKRFPTLGQPGWTKHRPRILKGIAVFWFLFGALLAGLPAIERNLGLPSWWRPLTETDKLELPVLGIMIMSCWAGLTYVMARVIDTRESVGLEPMSRPHDSNLCFLEGPLTEEGLPVAPSGVPVHHDIPLAADSAVIAYSQGRWWKARVIGLEPNGLIRIRYFGWDSKRDDSVPRSALQVETSTA